MQIALHTTYCHWVVFRDLRKKHKYCYCYYLPTELLKPRWHGFDSARHRLQPWQLSHSPARSINWRPREDPPKGILNGQNLLAPHKKRSEKCSTYRGTRLRQFLSSSVFYCVSFLPLKSTESPFSLDRMTSAHTFAHLSWYFQNEVRETRERWGGYGRASAVPYSWRPVTEVVFWGETKAESCLDLIHHWLKSRGVCYLYRMTKSPCKYDQWVFILWRITHMAFFPKMWESLFKSINVCAKVA